MTPKRFCFMFVGSGLILSAFVAAFNAAVDPYLLFNLPRRAGFNAIKPAVATRERLMKAYDAPRFSARTLILGSSRTDIGFDPSHSAWPSESKPIYNLSLVGANTAELTRYLQHFIATRLDIDAPLTAIVGLDFEEFLFRPVTTSDRTSAAAISVTAENSSEQRMAVLKDGRPNPVRSFSVWSDHVGAMLSLAALTDSIGTIFANLISGSVNIEPDGHLSESAFREFVLADGVAALFEQKNSETVRQYSAPHQVLSETPGGAIRDLPFVRDLIEVCTIHGVKLILFVQPAHSDRQELFDRMGYWKDFERWKRSLTDMVATERKKGADVTLWDFGGYERFMTEPVPIESDRREQLKWSWEPAHYKSALGDIMVSRMLRPKVSEAYGVELTPDSIEARLADVRRDREAYRARAPRELRRLEALYCHIRHCEY
jgi:hypothetical protein